jgi:DNA-binding FadR family transcriptional regulator
MSKPIIQKEATHKTEAGGLVERTVADIRRYIKESQLRAGDVMPTETTLAGQLGVSRTVMREAMRALAALRILDVGNGRRARVAAPDADALSMIIDHTVYTGQLSVQQTLDVRRTLESRTVSLAALRRTDSQARELLDLVERMSEELHNPLTVMELDIRFHEVIAQASGNSLYTILVHAFRVITQQTWDIGWRGRGTEENRRENIACHGRIATAIMMQDPIRAEAAMTEHFDSSVNVLLKAGIT